MNQLIKYYIFILILTLNQINFQFASEVNPDDDNTKKAEELKRGPASTPELKEESKNVENNPQYDQENLTHFTDLPNIDTFDYDLANKLKALKIYTWSVEDVLNWLGKIFENSTPERISQIKEVFGKLQINGNSLARIDLNDTSLELTQDEKNIIAKNLVKYLNP